MRHFQWLQRRDSNCQQAGIHALVPQGKGLLMKMETTLKNNCGFNNAVVRVLGNFHISNI
jgi:hypothetical protein